MADEVKNDRITDESIDDELDLGSLDDIELDAAIDGDGGVKKGKGRHPSTSTKTKAVDFVKGAVGGVASGAGDAIMNAMPEARVIASNVTDTLNDIQALRDDLSKQLAPLGLAVENATRKFLPKVEKVLPKTAYQKIKKKLDDRAETRKASTYTPESQATIDANTIKSELESVFGAQTEATLETARLTEKNVLIDRTLGSMRHKQITFQLVHLYDAMRSTELFHKTQHMAYMKKSLELKYKHVFIARDTLNLLRQSLAMQEGYMKAIVDNTALPDMMKQKAGDFVYGSRTKQYGEMMGSALGNIRGKIIDQLKNVKDQLVGSMQMATDGLNLYSDMSGMADEFGGGGGPNIAKFVGKGLGYAGGLLGIGPAIQGSKVAGALNQRLAGVRSSMATKMADLKERWGIGNSSNPLLNAISAILPNPFAPQKAASNDLISSPEKAVAFDLLTRQSITEIIPGYLSKIWHEVEMLRTGDETSEEKVYNVFDRSFTSTGDVRKSLYAQAFGSESSRKEAASRAIGIITAGTARNNAEKLETEPDLKKYAKDINQVFINHAVEVQPFRPADILNYCMNGVETPYITKIMNGVDNPDKVLEVIKDSIYHDRTLDNGVVNTIISIIDEHYRKSDAHKVVLAKARELYGYNDLIKKDGLIKSSIRGTAEMNLRKIAGIQGSMVKDESDIDESISEKVRSNTIEGLGEYDAFVNPIISKAKSAKQYAKDKLSRAGTSVKNAASVSASAIGGAVETATSTLGKAVAAPMASIKGSVDRFMPEWMRTASDTIGKHISETKDLISDVSSNIVNPAISNIASATKKTASSVMEQRRKEVARRREAANAEKKVDELDRIVFDEEGVIPKPVTRGVHIQQPKPSAAPSIGGIAEELSSASTSRVVESLVSKPTVETPDTSASNDTLSAILDHLTGWKETISEEHGLIFDATAQIDETLRNLKLTGAPSPTGGMIYSTSAPQSKLERRVRKLGKGVKAIGKGIGAGIKNVGKLYAHVYGAALKGAGTAISGVAVAAKDIIGKVGRGAKGIAKWATHKEDYVDVYVKGKEGGMPLVSARKQREEGIYYKSTGKRVMKSADIDQPCVDKDGNLVITPEDLKAGLVMSNSSPLGKLGAGALALGKGYFSVYGKALTGIASVAKTALKVLFGAKERYVDVYRKGEISKGPLITARMQKEEGVFFFESGKRVDKTSDIHEPVCDRDRKVLISKEDVEHGLVDVNNKPLGSGGGGLIGAMLPGLKKLGSIAGEATKSLTGIYGTAYKGILDLGIGGLKGAGKFLTRALGLDLSKGGVGDGEQTISILQKMQADLALIADQYRKKTKPGDADGDGDIDGSYADQAQKKEKSKAERFDARDLHKDVSWGKKDEESDGSGDGDDDSSLTDLLDFLPEKWKKKGRRIKRKGKALKRLGKRKLSKFGSRAAKGLGKFGGAAGKLLARGGGKALSLAAGGGAATLGTLKGAGSLLGSGAKSATKGIGSSLGKAAGKFAGKGLLKGAARFLGPVGLALTAGMALSDGVSGYSRAGEIFGKDEKDLNFNDKGSAGVGSALSGLTFGLLPEKWGANIAKYTGLGALTGGAVEGTKWIGKKLGFADDMTPEEKQRYAELEEMSKSGPLYPEQQKEFDALKKKKGGFGKGLLGIGKAAVMGSPVGLAYTAGKAIFKGIKSLFSSDKDKCDSLRKQIEEKIQKDGDPTGTLNKGLTAFENYVKREQYDIALKLGKDLLGFKPGEESSKMFNLDAYEKMSKDANTLIEKIGKAQSETNGFLHPMKSMKLAGLMNIVRSGSSKWGPEFFKDTEKKLSEIMGTADYVPKPENMDDEIFEKGKELLKTIQAQNDKRSWIGSPIVKTRLNSLYNEVNSDPSSWNKETISKWHSNLAEIDSDYTAPSADSKTDSTTPVNKVETVQEKIANDIGQTKTINDGTHDTVKHTQTDSGYTAERSGIRIAGEPIRKDGLSDKQMDMISVGLQMGHVKYPAYVMEMYNKQRPEYEARIAEESKNQPPSEFDDLFASGGIISPAGRFATQPTADVDGAGNNILYGEAGTEAIMPIKDKPGNLLNRVGSKLGDILSGKSVGEMSTGAELTEGSVHAGSEAAEPMENMMANELAKVVSRNKYASGGFTNFVGNLFSKDGMGTNRELLKILVDHVEKYYDQYLRSNNYGNPFRFIAEECPIDHKNLKGFTDADITNDTIEALNHAIYENHRGEEIPKDILEKYNRYLTDQEAYRKKYGNSLGYGDSVGNGLVQAEDGTKYTFEEEARDREASNANRISENMERRIKGQFDTNRKLGFFDRMLDRNSINSLEADSVSEFAKGGFISKLGGTLSVGKIGLPSILGRIGRGVQSLLNRDSSLPSASITGLRDRGAISVPGSDRVVSNVSPRDTVTQTPSTPPSQEIKSTIKLEGSDNIVATNKEMADQIRLLNQNTENLYKMMNAILSKEGIKVQGIDLLTKVVATTGSRPTQSGSNTTIIQTIPQESGIDLRKKAM